MITRSRRRVRGGKRPGKLDLRPLDRNGQRRGGKRANAGRKPRVPGRSSERHQRRAEVNPRHPQHVTLRVVGAVGHLRKRFVWRAIRGALVVTAARRDFRIVHLSLQGDHLHLLCEADTKRALASGVKGFEISAAKRINDALRVGSVRRTGQVFADRYHVRSISTVRGTRNGLSYVLNNWRHHRGARGPVLFDGKLDPYSSAIWFPGWRERTTRTVHSPPGYDPPPVRPPRTWLLAEGWKRSKCVSCSTGSTFRDPDDALIYCAGCTPRPASRLSRAARTSSIASQQAL